MFLKKYHPLFFLVCLQLFVILNYKQGYTSGRLSYSRDLFHDPAAVLVWLAAATLGQWASG